MKVLLVNGSSKNNGCTSVALSEVARALREEGIETETRNPIKRIGQILIDLVGKNRAEK